MTTTDLIIIGSGPGGYKAAEYAAKSGLAVTIIEKGDVGGTCLNCGCIPTKTLCHHAEIIDALSDTAASGLKALSYEIDFAAIMARKNAVVETLRSGVEQLMSMPGITLVRGNAVLVDANTVAVDGEEFSAPHIIIATGSSAKMPPVAGIDSERVVTSTELLCVDHIPESLAIVGAGVIGMEFASVFSRLGSKVVVIEFLKECLPTMDSDIAKRLRKSLEKQGVEFFMQSAVVGINGAEVTFERKGKQQSVEAEMILVATGRKPNSEGLNLDAVGVLTERGAIVVDDNMQTSVPSIYAIGDVNARQMLAHAATFQGFRAVNHILGRADDIRLDIMPAAVFTIPQAASVGKTDDQCKAEGTECTVKKGYYRSNGKALAMAATEGLVKIVAAADGRIIGCHALGAHAADIVQEVAALMNRDATIAELGDIVHIHPTVNEVLQDAARG